MMRPEKFISSPIRATSGTSLRSLLLRSLAWVYEDSQLGVTALQLDGQLPERSVAVATAGVGAEASVDRPEARDARGLQAHQGAFPELEVGLRRILDQQQDVPTAQCLRQLGDGEGARRRPGTDPEGA